MRLSVCCVYSSLFFFLFYFSFIFLFAYLLVPYTFLLSFFPSFLLSFLSLISHISIPSYHLLLIILVHEISTVMFSYFFSLPSCSALLHFYNQSSLFVFLSWIPSHQNCYSHYAVLFLFILCREFSFKYFLFIYLFIYLYIYISVHFFLISGVVRSWSHPTHLRYWPSYWGDILPKCSWHMPINLLRRSVCRYLFTMFPLLVYPFHYSTSFTFFSSIFLFVCLFVRLIVCWVFLILYILIFTCQFSFLFHPLPTPPSRRLDKSLSHVNLNLWIN